MNIAVISLFANVFTTFSYALFLFLTERMRLKSARLARQQELLEKDLLAALTDFTDSFSRMRSHAGEDALLRFASSCYRLYGLIPDESARADLLELLRTLYSGSFDFDAASHSVMQVSSSVVSLITPTATRR